MVDRTATDVAQMLDIGEPRTAYLIARDAALPTRDIYRTEQEFTAGWIALRFLTDPATAARHFARIGVGSVNPTTLARAGYWQGRAAEAAGRSQDARAAYTAACGAIDQLLRSAGARETRLAADRTEWCSRRPIARESNDWRSSARFNCSTSWTNAKSQSRFLPTWAKMAIPTRWWGSANSPPVAATPAACC